MERKPDSQRKLEYGVEPEASDPTGFRVHDNIIIRCKGTMLGDLPGGVVIVDEPPGDPDPSPYFTFDSTTPL